MLGLKLNHVSKRGHRVYQCCRCWRIHEVCDKHPFLVDAIFMDDFLLRDQIRCYLATPMGAHNNFINLPSRCGEIGLYFDIELECQHHCCRDFHQNRDIPSSYIVASRFDLVPLSVREDITHVTSSIVENVLSLCEYQFGCTCGPTFHYLNEHLNGKVSLTWLSLVEIVRCKCFDQTKF